MTSEAEQILLQNSTTFPLQYVASNVIEGTIGEEDAADVNGNQAQLNTSTQNQNMMAHNHMNLINANPNANTVNPNTNANSNTRHTLMLPLSSNSPPNALNLASNNGLNNGDASTTITTTSSTNSSTSNSPINPASPASSGSGYAPIAANVFPKPAPCTLQAIFGSPALNLEKVDKNQIIKANMLLCKVFLIRSANRYVETKKFWFLYENILPENLRMNQSNFGKLSRQWRETGQFDFGDLGSENSNEGEAQIPQKTPRGPKNNRGTKFKGGHNCWMGVELNLDFTLSSLVEDYQALRTILRKQELILNRNLFEQYYLWISNSESTVKKCDGTPGVKCLTKAEYLNNENQYSILIPIPGTLQDLTQEISNRKYILRGKRTFDEAFEIHKNWVGSFEFSQELPSDVDLVLPKKNKNTFVQQDGVIKLYFQKNRKGVISRWG